MNTVMQRDERGRMTAVGTGDPGRCPVNNLEALPETEHPAWCAPALCYCTEEGVRVHQQAPVSWEDGPADTRFETKLLSPEDEIPGTTYLQLELRSVRFRGSYVHALLPLADARLRDQLSAHLDAADSDPSTADGATGRRRPPSTVSREAVSGRAPRTAAGPR